MPDAYYFYKILKSGNTDDHLALFNGLPDLPIKNDIKFLFNTDDRLHSYMAFGTLLVSYANGFDLKIGAELGLALYWYGKELFQSGNKNVLLMTIMGHARSFINASNSLRNFQKALDFINEELPYWRQNFDQINEFKSIERQGYLENYKSLLVTKLSILIQLNETEKAWQYLKDKEEEMVGSPASDLELYRQKRNLMNFRQDAREEWPDGDEQQKRIFKNQKKLNRQMLESLRQLLGKSSQEQMLIDKIARAENSNAANDAVLSNLDKTLSWGESLLTHGNNTLNEISLRQKIRSASIIFVDNNPKSEEIDESLGILKEVLQEVSQIGNIDLINAALHGLYLCYSSLENFSDAADQLIAIRKNLEVIRNGEDDPVRREGVFQAYPDLFNDMVKQLYQAGRYIDMLDAMEAAKGNAMMGAGNQPTGNILQQYELWNMQSRLQPLLAKENAHYLSFHVNNDATYVCLLTKNGTLEARKIAIGKKQITNWLRKGLQDPQNWRRQIFRVDIIARLSPLVGWLDEFFLNGQINSEDHICYAADYLLNTFPLHYLVTGTQKLVERCTVSRIHFAGQLIHLLEQPAVKPENAIFMQVSSEEDDWVTRQAWSKNQYDLQHYFKGYKLSKLYEQNATLSNVMQNLAGLQLIHFATHGFFPISKNPFNNSGLLLADKHNLPVLHLANPDHSYNQDGIHLLSPRRLLKDAGSILGHSLDLNGSHISMQACVSGYSRGGSASEAQGLECAFFQLGIHSMISTFWNVDITNAALFYQIFYQEWLGNGQSRARAHQLAIIKLKNARHYEGLPHEYFWAGYGLSGDWR